MKHYIYFLLLIVIISFSACYPSDPEVSPFVGKWQTSTGVMVNITNEYIFLKNHSRPDYRYTMDDKAFYLEYLKIKYSRECPYEYKDGVLYVKEFIPYLMFDGYEDAVLTRVKK